MGSLIIVLLTTRSVAIPGAPHCRRWAEASGVATGARYAGTPVRLADKADVVKPPSAGEPLYCNAYLQVVSVKQALSPSEFITVLISLSAHRLSIIFTKSLCPVV